MYNKVILIGTIKNPVVTKPLNSNLQLGILQIETERTIVKQGVPTLEQQLIDCELWGKQLEEANKFDVGSMIIVEGRVKSKRVPNLKTGGESCFTSVVIERIQPVDEPEEMKSTAKSMIDQDMDLPF